MSYASFDLETTIRQQFKRKASPFYGINDIVAFGVKYKGDTENTGYYFPEHPYDDWFIDMLNKSKLLVGFNIKFDLHHAICQSERNRLAFLQWVADGGQIWCGQLAEYLIHGQQQEYQMASMDETAPRYGGSLKNDAVKALWAAGIDTCDIDRDLLMEYLTGDPDDPMDLGDIGNTERIFLGQLNVLRARGGIRSALLNMGALLFTIEAEFNGMYVDKELGLKLAEEVAAELDRLNSRLNEYVTGLPFTFKWTSRFHLSALVFGGSVKYVDKEFVLDLDGNKTYFQKDETHWVLNSGETTATPPGDASLEEVAQYAVFAGGKNKGCFKTKKVKVNDIERGPKMRNADFFYEFPGYTKPEKEWESSTEGVYSVASDVIEALGERDIPFLQDLAARAAMAKDLGTYYITTDEDTGEQKGMLTLVGPDGIIHHKLNMVNTITARLSSSDPNLQNVSGGAKSKVKTVFVSRFGEDGRVIQSDFTALEVYVQAVLTMCRQLILDLRKGLDMHCNRLSQKLGLSYEEVYRRYKEGDKEIAKGRKGSKEFSFQRAYGAGKKKIAESTGMSEDDVQALIDAEEAMYPEVELFYSRLTAAIIRNRVPTSRFCKHPQVPGLDCQLGRSHYVTPDGKMYSYSESPSPEFVARKPASKGGTPQSFSPTEIKNYVVQGTGGEWAKAAMWLAVRAFAKRGNFGGRAFLVNQVHDAIYVDAAKEVAFEAAALLHACMLEASNLMEYHFEWPLPVGVPTETKWGPSMMDEEDMPEGFDAKVHELQAWVRTTFVGDNIPTYEKEQ